MKRFVALSTCMIERGVPLFFRTERAYDARTGARIIDDRRGRVEPLMGLRVSRSEPQRSTILHRVLQCAAGAKSRDPGRWNEDF